MYYNYVLLTCIDFEKNKGIHIMIARIAAHLFIHIFIIDEFGKLNDVYMYIYIYIYIYISVSIAYRNRDIISTYSAYSSESNYFDLSLRCV